jgi:hypothetical protein
MLEVEREVIGRHALWTLGKRDQEKMALLTRPPGLSNRLLPPELSSL